MSYSIVIPLGGPKATAERIAMEIKDLCGYECEVVKDLAPAADAYAPLQPLIAMEPAK